MTQALLEASLTSPDLGISAVEWLPETGKLAVYATADEATFAAAMSEAKLDGAVEHRPAVLDAIGKAELANDIVGTNGKLGSGDRVVEVEPSLDGSEVRVVLDESNRGRTISADARSEISAKAKAKGKGKGVTVTVEYGAAAQPALRNHAANPSTYSGAVMTRVGANSACTTGYRMTQTSGNVPVMGSAHHCHAGVEGQSWKYTTVDGYPVAKAYSAYGAGLSNGDVSVWKGPMADHMLPGIFIGDHTVSGSGVYSIKGAIHSVVGANVCYSGSFSGTVCSNTIMATGLTVCYTGLPCYNNIVRTQQATGIPALGNGDSGGPVYSTSSGIYATGIISGMSNGTATCTGEPGSSATGGRKCSATGLYAPIAELMTAGYGLNYIP
ncbi:hypothetical protein ASD19_13280 [Microbacterium sp. Root53]|uniref:hypothetical protein n=1 Tax=Microbacterium sp. Root53 TaxID=1736553 RepID=UPI0006F9EFC4|nr:hypothetical protein [Microbacterium sp. Root53]KQZ05802.1 hypothetical protein ASD19_13280 [Microbacterium sp. Root53]